MPAASFAAAQQPFESTLGRFAQMARTMEVSQAAAGSCQLAAEAEALNEDRKLLRNAQLGTEGSSGLPPGKGIKFHSNKQSAAASDRHQMLQASDPASSWLRNLLQAGPAPSTSSVPALSPSKRPQPMRMQHKGTAITRSPAAISARPAARAADASAVSVPSPQQLHGIPAVTSSAPHLQLATCPTQDTLAGRHSSDSACADTVRPSTTEVVQVTDQTIL